ncbi:MAG: hypothetical protein ACJAU6_003356 [Alphaproteobacteria bacterium]|jgi:hypothetical protein
MAARPLVQGENTETDGERLQNVLTWALSIGLMLALCTPFSTYIPWRIGPWPEVELPIISLHFTAALCSAILMLLHFASTRRSAERPVIDAVWSAPVLICAAIGLWSAAVAPFATFPLLSIIGAPQTAEGAVSWMDMAVFVAAARYCVRIPHARIVVLSALTGLAFVLPALSFFPETRPIWFNDYLAFLGLAAAFAIPGYASPSQSPLSIKYIALGVIAAIPSIMVSSNQAAFVIFPALCLPTYLLVSYLRREPSRLVFLRTALALGVLLIIVAAPIAVSIFGAGDSMKSLQSRDRIQRVLATPLRDAPSTWFIGRGWGHTQRDFSDSLFQANAKIWDGGWDAPQRDVFHSHNGFFEAVLSAGVPAAIGVVALVISAVLFCAPQTLAVAGAFALGYAALGSLWFQLSLTLPATAIAFAAFSTTISPGPHRRTNSLLVFTLLGVICAFSVFTAATLGHFLVKSSLAETSIEDQKLAAATNILLCPDYPDDSWRGNVVIAHQTARFARDFSRLAQTQRPDSITLKKFLYFYCLSELRGFSQKSIRLLRIALTSQANFAFKNEFAPFREKPPFNGATWDRLANEYVSQGSKRTDALLSYMAWLLKNKETAKLEFTVRNILTANPNDPVGLWFYGISALVKGGEENKNIGVKALHRSVNAGIERWTSIPESIRKLLSVDK